MPDLPASWRERLAVIPSQAAARVRSPRLVAAGLVAGSLAVAATVAVVALRGSPAAPELTMPRAGAAGGTPTRPPPVGAAPTGPAAAGSGGAGEEVGPPTGAGASGPAPAVYVHAAGAVARPGVYRVEAGGRVADLVDAAGGPAADADLDRVNLAARVADGERVFVPRRGQPVPGVVAGGGSGPGTGAGETGAPLDLNTATLEQLDALPGVGPATAQAIVDYRTEHGRFSQVQDLLEVRGIGEAKLAALRSRVRV